MPSFCSVADRPKLSHHTPANAPATEIHLRSSANRTPAGLERVIGFLTVLLFGAFSFAASAQPPAPLPQSGQTACYSPDGAPIVCADTGQDGEVRAGIAWPSPRFTVSGDCVTDNLTGLMWTRGNYPRNGIFTATWQQALSYTDGLSLCGYSDWRLPNVNEMESLYNAGMSSNASWLRTQGFGVSVPDANDFLNWTSTTVSYNQDYVWAIDFYIGVVRPQTTLPWVEYSTKVTYPTTLSFWPVRGTSTGPAAVAQTGQTTSYAAGDDGVLRAGAAWPSPRFTVTGDCVTDQLTGLMWARNANLPGRPMPWEDALAYVMDINSGGQPLCGYSDWHLPNRKELRSLANYGSFFNTWLASQGFANVMSGYIEWAPGRWSSGMYWTSTTLLGGGWWEPVMANSLGTYAGDLIYDLKFDANQFVWPVRTAGVAATPAADLTVALGDAPDPVTPGSNLTYTISVGNAGPGAATGVTLTDTLPGGVSFVSAVSSQGGCTGTTTINCTLGTLAAGANVSVTLVVIPATAGGLTNTVSVTAVETDPNPANNAATAATTVTAPTTSSTLTVAKAGSGSGTVSSTPAGISCGADCTEPYANGTVVTLTAAPATGSVFAGWSGNADCADGNVTMDAGKSCTASFNLSVTAAGNADLALTVSAAPSPVKVNTDLTYTLVVRNNGPDAATGVVLNDTLSRSVTLVSADASQGACTGGVPVICNLGPLASGQQATVALVVRPFKTGDIDNKAQVTAGQKDPNTGNNKLQTTVQSVP